MVKCYSPHYSGMSGTAGKSGVHMVRRGVWIMREYLIPHNPQTVQQVIVRDDFAAAVTAWHTFDATQKACYDYYAAGMLASGYNIYVGAYRLAADAGAKTALEPTAFTTTVQEADSPSDLIENAIVTIYETGSSVVRFRGYTDASGEVTGALRADGSKTYDIKAEATGYTDEWLYGKTPTDATVTMYMEAS